MAASITGVFVKVDDGYFAYVKEEPSAITEGRTIEEARNNLIDAYTQIQIARKNRRERKEAAERETLEFEAELQRSHREVTEEVINTPDILVEVLA
jgi:predicted RNase H-like HicB family nuclease